MEGHLEVAKSMRFHLNADVAGQQSLWIVLHGYGQLSKYFIRKFDSLDPATHLVVAPEGMHRFYLEGFSGRVGASWMTKEDRLTDIVDYVAALNRLLDHFKSRFDSDFKLNILGFSQGAATAVRWLCQSEIECHQLVLWAGSFPPDIDFEKDVETLKNTSITSLVGTEDPFFSDENSRKLTGIMDEYEIPYESRVFEGSHDVYPGPLQLLIQSWT